MTEIERCDDLLLDHQMCFALYSTSLALTKIYKPLLQELGLTYPQYLAMLVLWEQEGLTVSEVSARLLTDPGSLTPLLKRLEAESLISRTRSRDDERVVLLHLTEQGRALHEKAKGIPRCILATTGKEPEGLKTLRDDLIEMRSSFQRHL